MKVLVTGLSGFVGSHCAELMDATGLALGGAPVDLRAFVDVCEAVDATKVDAVIHLAAQSNVPASFEDPVATLDINVLGTLNLLMALRRTGFRGRFLYVGSGDVYGLVPECEFPVSESLPPRPRNPYAASKVAAEAVCYQWSQTGPFDVLMVRPFNHIGPRQDSRFSVSDFARQIVRIKLGKAPPAMPVGDIECTRDFTDVRDVVKAYVDVLEKGECGDIYNVCSGMERSLSRIIKSLSSIADTPVQCVVDPARLRLSEQHRMVGDFTSLRRRTGWEPRIAFERTLSDILAYWEEQERV